jgi:hypothetical protein
MAVCSSSGLSGFPINATGWTSIIDKASYVIKSDISLQLDPSNMQINYNNGFCGVNGQNTFFMGGSQYIIRGIRLCKSSQSGLSVNRPIAEFNIWGTPTATSSVLSSIALLNIPIFQASVNSTTGVYFINYLNNQFVKFDNLIPKGSDINIVRYNTCIETNINTTISIVVGYWENGISITQENIRLLPSQLLDFGVPAFLINSKLLSSFSLSASGGKTSLVYTNNDAMKILIPYPGTAGVSDLTKFRYIQGFLDSKEPTRTTNAYKCISINPLRDIKNGQILINPDTGKRLSDELADSEARDVSDKGKTDSSIGDTMEMLAIFIGVCLALFLLFIVFYYIAHIFTGNVEVIKEPMVINTQPPTAAYSKP